MDQHDRGTDDGRKPLFPPIREMDTMKGGQLPAVPAERLEALSPDSRGWKSPVRGRRPAVRARRGTRTLT